MYFGSTKKASSVVQQPSVKIMEKLYSTDLFSYKVPLTPTGKQNVTWRVTNKYGYLRWVVMEPWSCDITKLTNEELYTVRNQFVGDKYFYSQINDIIKARQAIHPLLEAATKEQVLELEQRTIKKAVTAQLKNKTPPRYYNKLINDINLWRKKYGTT